MGRNHEAALRSGRADAPPDDELVRRVLAGEVDCFAALVDRYQVRLYRYALGMVLHPDAAEDLTQDALVKAYASLGECRDPAKFGTWVFRILRNRCLDHLKARRQTDVRLDDRPDIPATDAGPDAFLERHALKTVLERVLAQLPTSLREAFLLKHAHDLTYEEMAETVGASVSALRMRVHRAREMLQSLLAAEGRTGIGRM